MTFFFQTEIILIVVSYLLSEHVQSIEGRVDPAQEVVKGRGLNEIHSMCTQVIGNFGVEREGRLERERERVVGSQYMHFFIHF